ncbi:MAG: AMP-binding protein [Methylocella sp.]
MSDNGFQQKPAAQELRATMRVAPEVRRKYEQDGLWCDDTLTRWLAACVVRAGDRAAEISSGGSTTYRELAEKAERFARGLYDIGIRAGDVVSMQLPNTCEFLIGYFAIARLGAVMSTVHLPYRTAEIRTLLSHGTSVAFIGLAAQKDFSPIAEVLALKRHLPALKHVIVVGDPIDGAVSFEDLMRAESSLPAEFTASPSDPFLLLFTSGTSAGPKAVPLSYEITLGNARVGVVEHRFKETDTVLSVAAYTHLLGLYSLHLTTKVGATNILFPAYSPPDLGAAISHHRPTVLVCAPAHLIGMMVSGLLDQIDFSSIRLIITAGSALPPDIAKEVSARLPNGFLTNLWGMTELQAGLYTRPGDPFEIVTSTSGRVAPGGEIRIADLSDVPLPVGAEGELQIRGSLLFPGYYKNDAANRLAFADGGWFRTGDLAVMDAAGNVRITGRKTEVINRGGMKYNPLDVENILSSHPKVAQVAIVPYPDEVLGQRACCFVVPRGRILPTLEELCAYLLERGMSKVKLPERLQIIEEMPITPTRKIMKGRLKELLKC